LPINGFLPVSELCTSSPFLYGSHALNFCNIRASRYIAAQHFVKSTFQRTTSTRMNDQQALHAMLPPWAEWNSNNKPSASPPEERAALALSLWESLEAEDREAIAQRHLEALRQDIRRGIEALDHGEATTYAEGDLEQLAADIKRRGRECLSSGRS
jgi:hypothetical protein